MTFIRWMIREDLDAVVEIDRMSFDDPLSGDEFIARLRCFNTIGMVAEADRVIVGYVIYSLHASHLFVSRLAVHPRHRMQRVGRTLLHKLFCKLHERRPEMLIDVLDTELGAHLFLKACGFTAESHGDVYRFSKRLHTGVLIG